MDLGIAGRRAIVCASSKGLGRGCAEALAAAGVHLVLNARGAEALEETVAAIATRHPGLEVTPVAADITTPAGRATVLEACPEPDILVTNAGGPPPGLWSDWSRDDFIAALDANMLTPIALMQAVLPAHLAIGQGADPGTGPVECRAHRTDRFRRRDEPAGGAERCDDQQSPARHPCYRPGRCARRRRGGSRGHYGRRGARPARGDHPRAALRNGGRVRRGLRLSLLGSRGLHHRPEHPSRRRRDQRHAVTGLRAHPRVAISNPMVLIG